MGEVECSVLLVQMKVYGDHAQLICNSCRLPIIHGGHLEKLKVLKDARRASFGF